MNNNGNKFVDLNTVHNNLLELKKIISTNYSSFNFNIFKDFSRNTSESISLNSPIKYILDNMKKKYWKNKYITIISDGKTNLSQKEINDIKKLSQKNKIMIIIVFLSKNKNINNVIYNKFPSHLNMNKNLKYLFDISSTVNYKNPFANHYINKNWTFPEGGVGKLFFETNIEGLNQFYKDLNEIKYEGVNIYLGDLNSEHLFQFKYKFLPKNQIFGTCWANAYSAAIYLTNKRIIGKAIKPFEYYRENLIKFGSDKNTDGGNIENKSVEKFFGANNIHFEKIKESEAKKAVMKGRFIVFTFYLNKKQWDNFSNFFRSNKPGILSKDILDKGCKLEKEPYVGHSVLLIEIKGNYLRFLNSWGSDWGDGGTFKLENASILKPYKTEELPEFYDIFFYENELSPEEKIFYSKNKTNIRGLLINFDKATINDIRKYINCFPKEFEFKCENCEKRGNITKSEPLFFKYSPHFYLDKEEVKVEVDKKDGLYKIYCPSCKNPNIVNGNLIGLLFPNTGPFIPKLIK